VRVVDQRPNQSTADRVELASIYADYGDTAVLALDFRRAAEQYRKAIRQVEGRSPVWAIVYRMNEADALANYGRYKPDDEATKSAIALYQSVVKDSAGGKNPVAWASAQNNLGNALQVLGERTNNAQLAADSVAAFEAALTAWSHERFPLEWANVQNSLASALRNIGENESGADNLTKSVAAQGMEVLTSAGVESLKADAKGVAAKIKSKDGKVEERGYSHAIVAVGIAPNTENIGIDKLGVKTTKGHIDTDPMCRTNVPGIWAIGDVTAPPWLAHKASHEGIIAAEAIAQVLGNKDVHPHAMDVSNIPGCTYCRPQVASVGLTEAKAKEAGHEVRVGRFPFPGNGKAIAMGETEGFVKTVFDAKTGELLGAHMIGAEVTELIQGFTVGKTAELVETDFINTVYPHPTLSEMMHESVLAAYGRVIHI